MPPLPGLPPVLNSARHLTNPTPSHRPTNHPITGTSIYLQRRPFHPDRFADFVESVAAASYTALENTMNAQGGASTGAMSKDLERVITGLLRSKGFLWLACTDQAALYYSHAGALSGFGRTAGPVLVFW